MLSSSGLGLGLAQRPSPSLLSFSRPPSRPNSARPNSSPRHHMAGLSLSVPRSRLPRSLNRILGIALLLALAVFTLNLSRAPPSSGVWDASSSVDRSDHSLGLALFRRFWKPRKPSWLRDASKTPNYLSHGPNLSRLNRTAPRRTSRGVSRISVPGSNPEEFVTGSLPTIEEAFARLHPRLREIKELVPKIPREHELWSPLFPPFLTKDQTERFKHLKAEWDEDEGQWVEVERRWYLVTVCRQVAGK
jgi:alpha-1,3-mannosyltransferase